MTWGLPFWPIKEKESELSREWGFYFDIAGDCTSSPAEIDSMKKMNEMTARPLVKKYGKNWHEKFSQQLKLRMATPDGMHKLYLRYTNSYLHCEELLRSRGDTLFTRFKPTARRGVYIVEALGWSRKDTVNEWGSFIKYRIDNRQSGLELIRDKFIKEDDHHKHGHLYYVDSIYEIRQK